MSFLFFYVQVDPLNPANALESKRACATSLPTMTAQGMVWVWPDVSREGISESVVTKPKIMEGVDERAMSYLVVSREMPVGRWVWMDGCDGWMDLCTFSM